MSSPDDAFAAMQAVTDTYGPPAGVIAHSLGAITTLPAMQDGLTPNRLVYIAPSPSPIAYSFQMATTLGYGERTRKGLMERVERLARRPLADVEILTAPQRMPLAPTLIVHDRTDKTAPYDHSVRLAEAWPTSTFITTDGLGHQRILADPETIKQTVNFITASN
jgi:pimeloyl-ACP methyl ester carboxylesterase